MAYILADRVKASFTTTGTGAVTLSTTPTGYVTFVSVMADGDTCPYIASGRTSAEWEVGIGTIGTTGTVMTRTTVIASSNAGAAVNFSSGTKDIALGTCALLNNKTVVKGNTGAAPAPNCLDGMIQQWTLSANATWGAPTGAYQIGQQLTLAVTSSGVFTTAWNAAYRNAPAWAVAANTLKATVMFVYDGTNWQFIGGSTAFA